MKYLLSALISVVAPLLLVAQPSAQEVRDAHPGFAGLRCIVVGVSGARSDMATSKKADLGPLASELGDAMLVWLRSRISQLIVREAGAPSDCPNNVWFHVEIVESSPSLPSFHVSTARLALSRAVVLAGRSGAFHSTVWDTGYTYWGQQGNLSGRSIEVLDKLLTSFAAQYYRTGLDRVPR